MERVMLTPLTPEEQQFAADHYPHLEWCIRSQCLTEDMADIAALGYLHAVKKWFARPDLHRWAFRTIVNWTVKSHVQGELQKRKVRIQTISLEDTIPDTDGLTYGDTVTYDNLSYLKEDHMKVSYNVELPTRYPRYTKSDETIAIEGFLVGKMKNMCFEYETVEEARKRAACIAVARRKKNHTQIYDMYRNDNRIYIVRL